MHFRSEIQFRRRFFVLHCRHSLMLPASLPGFFDSSGTGRALFRTRSAKKYRFRVVHPFRGKYWGEIFLYRISGTFGGFVPPGSVIRLERPYRLFGCSVLSIVLFTLNVPRFNACRLRFRFRNRNNGAADPKNYNQRPEDDGSPAQKFVWFIRCFAKFAKSRARPKPPLFPFDLFTAITTIGRSEEHHYTHVNQNQLGRRNIFPLPTV